MFDKKSGLIKIRKRTVSEWLVLTFFLMPFALGFLTEVIGLPSFVRYVMDAILLFLGALLLFRKQITIPQKLKPLFWLVIIFFTYTLVGYIFNYQSVFYFVWGTRNMFRFYLAVLVFAVYIGFDEANKLLKLLDVLFWIDFAAIVFQFAVLHVHQDYMGGIFGIKNLTTGYTLIFLFIVIGRSLLQTFEEKEGYIYCTFKCVASLLIAAMTEIKFYYPAFIFMLLVAAFITRRSKKKIVFIVSAVLIAAISATLLSLWYSEFSDFLSWESIWEFATKKNYSSGRDLNRLSAISGLMEKYVVRLENQLFGLGLGNCDMSDVAIFNSAFYRNYSFLHYTWFAFAFIFIETGFAGLGLYLAYFVTIIVCSFKQMKNKTGDEAFCRLAILMSVLCIVLTFYNASLRTEAGYMAYFILSLPFLADTANEKLINKE